MKKAFGFLTKCLGAIVGFVSSIYAQSVKAQMLYMPAPTDHYSSPSSNPITPNIAGWATAVIGSVFFIFFVIVALVILIVKLATRRKPKRK